NVRELENILERAGTLAGSPVIGLGDLPESVSGLVGGTSPQLLTLPEDGCDLEQVLNEVERRFLLEALDRTGGVRTQAAKLLGISFRSLRYRLVKQMLVDQEGASEPADDDSDSEETAAK
ncbi:MAG TPA: helix-turn-helix domain-containing protein, partial [Polyangiaceae bacterium]|nr:helix-turn-helix domain-containing protein [Polyangiaceae bacterium]